jgi:hypothetical protein
MARKPSQEGPADEMSTSSLTDPASPQPQAKVRAMGILANRNCFSSLRYQDLDDASKGKEPMSDMVSDVEPQDRPSEPLAISHESQDPPGRISPHDGERSGSQVLSMPHSRGQSVRTASPALSQGKVAVVDESSESDASHHHHARREFCLSLSVYYLTECMR